MIRDTIYTLGAGNPTRTIPESFDQTVKIKGNVKQVASLKNRFGYRLHIGDEVFYSDQNPCRVYLFDRSTDKYVPYTSSELQQLLINVDGTVYALKLDWFDSELREIPPQPEYQIWTDLPDGYLGKVSSIVYDTIPTEQFQISTAGSLFKDAEIYAGEECVYLVRKIGEQYLASTFMKTY